MFTLNDMKKISPVVIVGLALTVMCLVLFIAGPDFIRNISNIAYDELIKRVNEPVKSGRIAIVDLDDASLKQFDQWPWPRYLVAELTQKIIDAGASVVAFDIVFAEKDRMSPAAIKEDINKHLHLDVELRGVPANLADFDKVFADVLEKGKIILGCSMHPVDELVSEVDTSIDPYYKERILPKGKKGNIHKSLMQANDIEIAIPILNRVASTAFFNAMNDPDGILRRNPLIWGFGLERIYPSLALEAVRMDQGISRCIVKYDEKGVLEIRLKDLVIPTDNAGRFVINYRRILENIEKSADTSFPTYSAADVLNGKVGQMALTNKIVFVGTSAAGLRDIKATPLTQFFPGVEVHATIADNILAGDMLSQPSEMAGVQFVVIALMGTFLSIFISRGKSWLSFLVSFAMILLAVKAGLVLLEKYHLVFIPAWVILSIIIIYPVLTTIKYWQEELQRKKVRDMFGTMVSKDVLHYLENNPGSFSLSGHKAEATMFYSDVTGFTTISESLDPEQVSELLNRYLSPMTEIIMQHRGYVDKYEGDLIMAEWGVPFAMDDHAVQACQAAIEQQKTLAELRPALKEEFGHEIHVRMGINSGSVTAGNMGSDKRFQYTVMGDAVNQAARFEPANKDYGTLIIIGETTYQAAKDFIEAKLLDRIVVKGKTRPVNIYELLAKKGELTPEKRNVADLYEQALRLHWDRKWDEAIECLDSVLDLDSSNGPGARMRERIIQYKGNPPPAAWAGEYVRTTKD